MTLEERVDDLAAALSAEITARGDGDAELSTTLQQTLHNYYADGGRNAVFESGRGLHAPQWRQNNFRRYNGSTHQEGVKYIHGNTGLAGANPLDPVMLEWISAYRTPMATRTGVEFYSTAWTTGAGTRLPVTINGSTYYAPYAPKYTAHAGIGNPLMFYGLYVYSINAGDQAVLGGTYLNGVLLTEDTALPAGWGQVGLLVEHQHDFTHKSPIRSKVGVVFHTMLELATPAEKAITTPWPCPVLAAYNPGDIYDNIELLEKVVYPETHNTSGTADWTAAVNAALLEAAASTPRKGIVLTQMYDVSSIEISGTLGNVPAFIRCDGGGFRANTADVNLFSVSNPHGVGVEVFEVRGSLELDGNSLATHAFHAKGLRRLRGAIKTLSARSHGAVFQSDDGYGIYYGEFSIDTTMNGGDGVHMYSSEDDPSTPGVDEAFNRNAANDITIISHFNRGRGLFMSHAQNNVRLTAEQCAGVGAHLEKCRGNNLNIMYEEHCGNTRFATLYGDANVADNTSGTDVALYLAKDAFNVKVQGSRVIGIDQFEDDVRPFGYNGYHRWSGQSPQIVPTIDDLPNLSGTVSVDGIRFFVADIGKDAWFDGNQYLIDNAYIWDAFYAPEYTAGTKIYDNGDFYELGSRTGSTVVSDLLSGNRTGTITVSESGLGSFGTSTTDNLVDGVIEPASAANSWTASSNNIALTGTQSITFDLGRTFVITSLISHTQAAAVSGNWVLEGSTDNVTYTELVAATTWGINQQWDASANAVGYRYIRLRGVSGTMQWYFIKEIDFTGTAPANDPTVRPSTEDGTTLREWWLTSRSPVMDGSGESLATMQTFLPNPILSKVNDKVIVENLDTAEGEYETLIYRKVIKKVSGTVTHLWERVF